MDRRAGPFCRTSSARVACLLGLVLLGCEGAQAVLDARGTHAAASARFAWVLFACAGAIFAVVLGFVALAARGPAGARALLASDRTVLVGGIVLPVLTLSTVLFFSLRLEAGSGEPEPPAFTVEVTGEQWWWRVQYLDGDGIREFETANEIRIPVGRPVALRLRAADVIHSFWVPSLAGKLDMIPGRVNRMRLQADEAGVYRGQCAEYCGGAHAMMALHVVAEPEPAFADWRARQRGAARQPAGAHATRGRELFFTSGCAACHRVRGTLAGGTLGPDLTHVGSRLHVVSGFLPNHRGTLAGWIASAREIKPDNLMPSFRSLPGADLRALAAYLEGLE